MSYCSHCGTQLTSTDRFCPSCGAPVEGERRPSTAYRADTRRDDPFVQDGNAQQYGTVERRPWGEPQPYPAAPQKTESGLLTAAKVFMILACIAGAAFYLIPLAWMLPMTISLFNKAKHGRPISVGFKVCTLLFVNLIAGILLLAMPSDDANC